LRERKFPVFEHYFGSFFVYKQSILFDYPLVVFRFFRYISAETVIALITRVLYHNDQLVFDGRCARLAVELPGRKVVTEWGGFSSPLLGVIKSGNIRSGLEIDTRHQYVPIVRALIRS